MMLELLLWPFLAGVVLTGIHAYFGLHVLARGIVFVDLSLAQFAALGIAVAILAGHPVQSQATYWYALAFALGGAALFAFSRRYEKRLQQEAVIGIAYAVSTALGVLVLDRAPQGAEHIKQILIGSILTVTPQDVRDLGLLYAIIGAAHWLLRRPLLQASLQPALAARSRHVLVWDIVFYGSFALVVTSSVRIAGVLLVFCYLIVPAAVAGLFVTGIRQRLLLAWALGGLLTVAGLGASWQWDLPTGPAVVTVFGASIALAAAFLCLRHAGMRQILQGGLGLAGVAGALLLAFPQMDQPWLDALEDWMPAVQEAFLSEAEIALRRDSESAKTHAAAELARLRAVEQEVRWGRQPMDADRQERLRQYLAGRSEMMAGDRLVLKELRADARKRERFGFGIPLLLAGLAGFALSTFPVRGKRDLGDYRR